MMFIRATISSAALSLVAVTATAQSPPASNIRSYVGEIVMSQSGELVAPWKEVKACYGKTETCKTAIFNTRTREVARLGDRWATRFKATGKGREVQRAESELAKAIRLAPGYTAATPAK